MPSPRRQTSEDLDLSNIQPPVKLGVTGAEQISRCLAGGSDEIKHLLRQECRIIFECCACMSLFRSLANFLAHKRVYCKEDHLLPSNDLASHVSILRQYIQTKAAAMATLAEGSNTTSTATTVTDLVSPPSTSSSTFPNGNPGIPEEGPFGEPYTESAQVSETPKRKKVKCPCEGEKSVSPGYDRPSLADKSANSKKRKLINEHLKVHLKKSPNTKAVNRSLSMLNGTADLTHDFGTEIVLLDTEEIKKKSPKKPPVTTSAPETEQKGSSEHELNKRILDGDSKEDSNSKSDTKIVKSKKKTNVAPHLLYPCLYCENVFPGTRMAIDHISAVHKKKKSLNVSKIRTKIRKKAFLWKSGKKMRRFQKKSKTPDKDKEEREEKEKSALSPTATTAATTTSSSSPEKTSPKLPDGESKVGKRGHVSHRCSYCTKVYLYKTAMERHQETCVKRIKALANSSSSDTESSAASPSPSKSCSPGSSSSSPSKPKVNHPSPKMPSQKLPATEKNFCQSPPKISPNCHIIEIHIPGLDRSKSEPNSPVQTPEGKIKPKTPNTAPAKSAQSSSSGGGADAKASPLVIPVRSEYPCPYCLIKPKKSFDLLFQHISEKHKDLRPSRKRVARFLINSGYKCAWCKSPPKFFKNRITLRRHKEREHGVVTPSLQPKVNGNNKS